MPLLRTIVDLTFLALSVVLITTLLADRYDRVGENAVQLEIQNLKKDILDVHLKNVMYLENRVNRVSESSDSYQVSVNSRISVLESRMQGLESRKKDSTRIVNNNSAVANGVPTVPQAAKE